MFAFNPKDVLAIQNVSGNNAFFESQEYEDSILEQSLKPNLNTYQNIQEKNELLKKSYNINHQTSEYSKGEPWAASDQSSGATKLIFVKNSNNSEDSD